MNQSVSIYMSYTKFSMLEINVGCHMYMRWVTSFSSFYSSLCSRYEISCKWSIRTIQHYLVLMWKLQFIGSAVEIVLSQTSLDKEILIHSQNNSIFDLEWSRAKRGTVVIRAIRAFFFIYSHFQNLRIHCSWKFWYVSSWCYFYAKKK